VTVLLVSMLLVAKMMVFPQAPDLPMGREVGKSGVTMTTARAHPTAAASRPVPRATALPDRAWHGLPTHPAASAAPASPTAPAVPAPERVGPERLLLWSGQTVRVAPATGAMADEAWQWELPRKPDQAGWHTDSDDCGRGTTVIGGHATWGWEGALMPLNTVGSQDAVVCYDAMGAPHRFLPVDYLLGDGDDPRSWYPDWPEPTLILYTCRPDLSGQVIVRFKAARGDPG
jgi:hypothetical protein